MFKNIIRRALSGGSAERNPEESSETGGTGYFSPAEGSQRDRRRGGYSLVELMVGSGALTMVMAGMFGALGQAAGLTENVRSAEFATQVLQIEMEEMLLMQWEGIEAMGQTSTFDPGSYFAEVPLRNYTCARTITNLEANMKEVRLTVAWQDLRGMEHQREFVTYYSKNGLYDFDYTSL